jgi:hypothetical protein
MIKYLRIAALALVGAMMTGCSSSEDSIAEEPQPPVNTGNIVTLTTTVSFDDGADTRALTGTGVKTFAKDETMAVIYHNGTETVKAVSHPLKDGDITNEGKSATFTFDLETPNTSQAVTYIYPAAMAGNTGVDYSKLISQDGTLATLASNYDLCTKSGAWNGANLPSLTLDNQLAILAVTLKNSDGSSDITGSIMSMTVSDGTNSYNVTGHDSDGHIYVAIRPTTSADITVTATAGTYTYTKSLSAKTYDAGNGYSVSWRMTPDPTVTLSTPLTFLAVTDGTIVVNKPKNSMKYYKNGAVATVITETTTIDVKAGDKVAFYGKGTCYYASDNNHTTFSGGTARVRVYGNIMSLLNETGYATATELSKDQVFRQLFDGNTTLTDASDLLLPAMTLTTNCYHGMFAYCTALTAAPATLPAETLASQCYFYMFSGCSSLTTAPKLNATTLADRCYWAMFAGCSSLTTAPALPAMTLTINCYSGMFSDCTALTAAPATLPAETLAISCYDSMFAGCTSLTTAPVLPAPTLVQKCYKYMFNGCTSLKAVTCLATDISADDCTLEWLENVAPTGTFTKASSMTTWPSDISGIPSGWTVVNAN